MTNRERILKTIKGEKIDQLAFIPRLDLWYKANQLAGTLPNKYRHASLMDICDDLKLGYHCLLPDFSLFEGESDTDIGLGVYHLSTNCYETVFHNVKKTIIRNANGSLRVTYHTPRGDITTEVVYNDQMKNSGITLRVIREHAIKSEDDWEAIAFLFENAEIIPRYDRLNEFQAYIGERAEAVAYAHTQACAMHLLIKDLMPMDTFYYAMADDILALEDLSKRIEPYMDQLFDVVSNAPSKLIFSGGNYDAAITAPPLFRKYIMPQIQKRADKAHTMGKFLICHTDGENQGLLDSIVESRMDIADSICPAPMTKITIGEYYKAFRDKITIWGGIPSIAVVDNIMSDNDFYSFLDRFFTQIDDGKRIILSIADTAPPSMRFDRLELIAKLAREI
jgi:hypothetical protein